LAVEMFQTEDEILVNEVAPRPHNSGHYWSKTSQFENHLRAILNLLLGTESKVAGIMVNLVGAGFTGNVVYENMEKYCWTSYTTYLR
jgi:5-(carboxyamino)imidazole ribonucleotide synthase